MEWWQIPNTVEQWRIGGFDHVMTNIAKDEGEVYLVCDKKCDCQKKEVKKVRGFRLTNLYNEKTVVMYGVLFPNGTLVTQQITETGHWTNALGVFADKDAAAVKQMFGYDKLIWDDEA